MTSWPCWARYVGLTPPGTECQPCRKRIFTVSPISVGYSEPPRRSLPQPSWSSYQPVASARGTRRGQQQLASDVRIGVFPHTNPTRQRGALAVGSSNAPPMSPPASSRIPTRRVSEECRRVTLTAPEPPSLALRVSVRQDRRTGVGRRAARPRWSFDQLTDCFRQFIAEGATHP